MHLLQRSLPSGLQVYSKPGSEGSTGECSALSCRFISATTVGQSSVNCAILSIYCCGPVSPKSSDYLGMILFSVCLFVFPQGSKWKIRTDLGEYQCQNGAAGAHEDRHTVDCLQIRCLERTVDKVTQEARAAESNRRPSSSRPVDLLTCGSGRAEAPTENLPQEELGSKATRATKSSSPKAWRGSTNTPSPPAGRTEKKQRSSCKIAAPHSDGPERNATSAQSHHTEQLKYGSVLAQSPHLWLRPPL